MEILIHLHDMNEPPPNLEVWILSVSLAPKEYLGKTQVQVAKPWLVGVRWATEPEAQPRLVSWSALIPPIGYQLLDECVQGAGSEPDGTCVVLP
jgi:hypothetical protein